MILDSEIMFSVEVTTYNQKEFIAQTLDSILNQKHNYRYEILIGDDCSSDGTQEIIKQYHKKFPDIIKPVYNKKNIGAMKNYYCTVMRAKGKYLMECAGDDYWLPGKVQKQINFMERNLDFAVCYGKAQVIDNINKEKTNSLGINYLNFEDLYYKGNGIPALTLCIRMDFFHKYLELIKPNEKNWLMEDYPFLIYSAFNTNLFFFNEYLAAYRIIENSISHQKDINKQIKFEKSIYDIRYFYSQLYNLEISEWNEKQIYEKLSPKKQNCNTIFRKIKKIIKCLLPYGVIKVIKRY